MKEPNHLQKFRDQINKLNVKDVEFSGATYQVLVQDLNLNEDYWVFLQIDHQGGLQDGFCSCESGYDLNGCPHLAAAYYYLFDEKGDALHQRFNRSLWNQLCKQSLEAYGDDPDSLLELDRGYYVLSMAGDNVAVSIKSIGKKNQDFLIDLLFNRPFETEETSLKFSNLTSDEIALWKEGAPSSQLRYDLSFWSDLAKWLVKLQESQKEYLISYNYSKKGIPNWIQVKFKEAEVGFYLTESQLINIIPTLNTVNSPLIVQDVLEDKIKAISFDQKKGQLLVKTSKSSKEVESKKRAESTLIKIDGWDFDPTIGFIAQGTHSLLKHSVLEGDELSEALSNYSFIISQFLKDYPIHQHPVVPKYLLSFDQNWDLHVLSYLFEPNDLTTGYSLLLKEWAYLEGHGFYSLQSKKFEDADQIIPLSKVSEFITQNRSWLNSQEGFETHVKSLEYHIGYQLSDNQRLTFTRLLSRHEANVRIHDFGSWVYYEGRGFYLKSAGSFNYLFKPGFSLSREQIPIFIKMNRDELELIPYFFNPICPITKSGLVIEVDDQSKITVKPKYELQDTFKGLHIELFDDIIYVDGHGFYELPNQLRLPEKYRHDIEIEGKELNDFISVELPTLKHLIVEIDPKLVPPEVCHLVATVVQKNPEKQGWIHFQFYYQTDRGLVSIFDLHKLMKGRKKLQFGLFKQGLIDLQDPKFDWIRLLGKDRLNKKDSLLSLSTLEFIRINAMNPIQMLDHDENKESATVLQELLQFKTPDKPNIEGLQSQLRPYQEKGILWLWFLYTHQLSGLLCDDMGLGKTHQAMALMASIVNLYKTLAEGQRPYFLVVCPTSVLYHWQDKLEAYFPDLKVCTFYGIDRKLENFQQDYDVLLTSYGILRNEKEQIKKINFELAVFDEIQVAKNQFSLVYSALIEVKANMKLGLTGTPIENRLRELKSLFDIVLPTYLPSESDYRNFFIKPIEKDQNHARRQLLHRLVNPLILRRKKEKVLEDLPEKIEEISYCDLSSEQSRLYCEVLENRRKHLMDELKDESGPVPYLHIFSLLSSLKQICDHPAVYLKDPDNYQVYSSGKWTLFLELLREARESKQKVVVFSQYLFMLDIIESYLGQQDIRFSSLRGSTNNREEQIRSFQKDPTCEVFVGSLHAAGLGIDLTAGSIVIHYDRWWNAAREDQATDRVYRIGQTRGVQVFKLVTKGTFEEKIDVMISRKGKLMEDVIGVDDQNTLKKFTREELMSLLNFDQIKQEPHDGQ